MNPTRWLRQNDSGVAMITVLMMMAVLAALASTVTVVTINNIRGADADRQSGSAQGVAEAGVSAALAYMNDVGLNSFTTTGCTTVGEFCHPSGKSVTIAGTNSRYKVFVQAIVPFTMAVNPATNAVDVGRYRIFSTGTDGSNPGTRSVQVDVAVSPFEFPIGVFGHSITAGGTGDLHYESMFTDGCILDRDKIEFVGIDSFHNIPAAAHSSSVISEHNTSCADAQSIHKTSVGFCNSAYPYDQDKLGGTLTAAAHPLCYQQYAGPPPYPTTSLVTSTTIYEQYKFQPPGLSASQLNTLRTAAQAQGFYFTSTHAIPAVLQDVNAWQTYKHPILFYDLKGSEVGEEVDLKDLKGYSRTTTNITETSTDCRGASAVVVVLNGDVAMNGNTVLAAHVFALSPSPYGNVGKLNGGFQLIGTVYANEIELTGTGDVRLDECALQNLPGPLFGLTTSNFVEIDPALGP